MPQNSQFRVSNCPVNNLQKATTQHQTRREIVTVISQLSSVNSHPVVKHREDISFESKTLISLPVFVLTFSAESGRTSTSLSAPWS